MHGKYPRRIKDADVDQVKTNKWLKTHGLTAETEGLIITAQDQSLATRSYHHRIIRDGIGPQCRIYGKHKESIDHIISGCSELAKTEYIQRHNCHPCLSANTHLWLSEPRHHFSHPSPSTREDFWWTNWLMCPRLKPTILWSGVESAKYSQPNICGLNSGALSRHCLKVGYTVGYTVNSAKSGAYRHSWLVQNILSSLSNECI